MQKVIKELIQSIMAVKEFDNYSGQVVVSRYDILQDKKVQVGQGLCQRYN